MDQGREIRHGDAMVFLVQPLVTRIDNRIIERRRTISQARILERLDHAEGNDAALIIWGLATSGIMTNDTFNVLISRFPEKLSMVDSSGQSGWAHIYKWGSADQSKKVAAIADAIPALRTSLRK